MECPGEAPCGTVRAWVDGCRLPPCEAVVIDLRERYDAAKWERVERLPVDLPEGVEHGERQGSKYYGCGCRPCLEADATYQRDRYAARKT